MSQAQRSCVSRSQVAGGEVTAPLGRAQEARDEADCEPPTPRMRARLTSVITPLHRYTVRSSFASAAPRSVEPLLAARWATVNLREGRRPG